MKDDEENGILENNYLGRILDQMCRDASTTTAGEWQRLEKVLCKMINEKALFRVELSESMPEGFTYRARVQRLLRIAEIVGV